MSRIKRDSSLGHWPPEDIEPVACCPICSGTRHLNLYAGLQDDVFHCAPGQWALNTCLGCGVAFLGPRPTPASIGRVYSSYYTHADRQNTDTSPIGRGGKLRGALRNGYLPLRNGYLNQRYGSTLQPANAFGWLAMQPMLNRKAQLDRMHRHLPRLQRKGEKLLDIGCGDGAFLKHASQLGWEAWGIEPDAKAAGRLSGFRVLQGSLPNISLPDASFDYITLSHVIEHLHDPVAALKEIHRLLKPGGKVWIATPNIESFGRRLFGASWIGIHSPAHLVLFNWRGIRQALTTAGFNSVELMPMYAQAKRHFSMSHCVNVGRNPFTASGNLPPRLRFASVVADLFATMLPRFREEIVVTAQKPAPTVRDGHNSLAEAR